MAHNHNAIVSTSNGIQFDVKHRDLKTEFLAIQNYYIDKPLTEFVMDEMNKRYFDLFNHFDLRDLEWKLIKYGNTSVFTPIRTIDKLAINGILST